jgi:hypothetical protein
MKIKGLPADVEIKKREKGKVIYNRKLRLDRSGEIDVPAGDDVEMVITAPDYVPKKVIVQNDDKEKDIILDRIRPDKPIVVDNIQFEINRAYLKKESLDLLDRLVVLLKQRQDRTVEVGGIPTAPVKGL